MKHTYWCLLRPWYRVKSHTTLENYKKYFFRHFWHTIYCFTVHIPKDPKRFWQFLKYKELLTFIFKGPTYLGMDIWVFCQAIYSGWCPPSLVNRSYSQVGLGWPAWAPVTPIRYCRISPHISLSYLIPFQNKVSIYDIPHNVSNVLQLFFAKYRKEIACAWKKKLYLSKKLCVC